MSVFRVFRPGALAGGLCGALVGASALGSAFTETSPTAFGAVPDGVTPVGGIVLDFVGISGNRVYSQLAAGDLFNGRFPSSPGTIGTQTGFSPAVRAALGGGLSELAVRVTLFDGDTAAGEFDFNDNTLLLDGTNIGNWSDVITQNTDQDGNPLAGGFSGGGFRNNLLDTGWFYSNDPAVLAAVFASLDADGELVLALTDVDPNDNVLDFTQGIDAALVGAGSGPTVQLADVAGNSGQGAVAGVFDEARGGSSPLAPITAVLDLLPTIADQQKALDMLGPRGVHLQVDTALRATTVQSSNIDSRINALNRGGPMQTVDISGMRLAYADDTLGLSDPWHAILAAPGTDSAAVVTDAGPTPDTDGDAIAPLGVLGGSAQPQNFGLFLLGSFTTGRRDTTANQSGGDFNSGGLTLGGDTRVNDRLVLGGAFGYAYDHTDFDDDSKFESSNFTFTAYGTVSLTDAWFIDGSLAYSLAAIDTSRRVVLPGLDQTARGDTLGHTFSTKLRTVYQHRIGPFSIGPEVDLRYAHVLVESYTETGAGPVSLNIAQQNADSLVVSLGGYATYEIACDGWLIVPFAGAAWQYELLDNDRLITATYTGASGSPFDVPTDGPERGSVDLAVGLTAVTDGGMTLYLDYNALLNDELVAHTVRAGLRVNF